MRCSEDDQVSVGLRQAHGHDVWERERKAATHTRAVICELCAAWRCAIGC